MAIAPGKRYPGSPVRIGGHFELDTGNDVDPATITFKFRGPCGPWTSYVYGTDPQVVKVNEGDYYVEVTPTQGGRWYWRWETTGASTAGAFEGNFVVQASAFDDGEFSDYA